MYPCINFITCTLYMYTCSGAATSSRHVWKGDGGSSEETRAKGCDALHWRRSEEVRNDRHSRKDQGINHRKPDKSCSSCKTYRMLLLQSKQTKRTSSISKSADKNKMEQTFEPDRRTRPRSLTQSAVPAAAAGSAGTRTKREIENNLKFIYCFLCSG